MSKQLSKREAIQKLNAIGGDDGEANHYEADEVLLAYVPPDVAAAYQRVVDRSQFWVTS